MLCTGTPRLRVVFAGCDVSLAQLCGKNISILCCKISQHKLDSAQTCLFPLQVEDKPLEWSTRAVTQIKLKFMTADYPGISQVSNHTWAIASADSDGHAHCDFL